MCVYFLLIEEQLSVRPPNGVVVLGDGSRHRIENEADLRDCVFGWARQVRAARAAVAVPIPVNPKPGQCRPCGLRKHCRQTNNEN